MKHLIIGGTGTLGRALAARVPLSDELIIFSRDELKQQEMRRDFPHAKFVLGDIRFVGALSRAMEGVDVAYHVAALKHVDVIEANPSEAIATNVHGTENVAMCAVSAGIKHVIFSSTDKAVLPINTYGMTKAISEKLLLNYNRTQIQTKFAIYRWGNVAGSRGSVVEAFARSLRNHGNVTVTDPRMTRFWLHINDAVDFMLATYREAPLDRVMIPQMRAANILDMARAIADVVGVESFEIKISGMRPGEKIHEVLDSNHDFCLRSDTAEQYDRFALRALVKKVLAAC